MALSALPNELLLEIADQISRDDRSLKSTERDLNSLVRVNRRFHNLLNESLYKLNYTRRHYKEWEKYERYSALHDGAYRGRLETITRAESFGQHASPADLILQATLGGQLHIVVFLFDRVRRRGAAPDLGRTTLCECIRLDRFDILKFLIDGGADCKDTTGQANRPLHAAAVYNNLAAANLLLQCGADIDAATQTGSTPLHVACRYKNADFALFVLEHGANVEPADAHGSTPLHTTSCYGNIDVARVLLEHGANVDAVADGATPLHVACSYGNTDVARLLLEHGANARAVTRVIGTTPLHGACRYGHQDAASLVLEHGANVDAVSEGSTPLHLACRHGTTDVVRLLLEHGANIEAFDARGSTPLHIAYETGNVDAASLVLAYGASLEATGIWSYTTPLHSACKDTRGGKVAFAELFLDHCADIEETDLAGRTPLHVASEAGRYDAVEMLLRRGADIDAEDRHGWTPLRVAVDAHRQRVAKMLIKHGARRTDGDDGLDALIPKCGNDNFYKDWI